MKRQTSRGRHGAAATRFCPRCVRDRSTHDDLCPECGDRLLEQGYCPVCERPWRARVGAICPKHEVPLESSEIASVESPEDEARPTRWLTVLRFSHPSRAMAPRLRLESEGIPTFLDGERMASEAWLATGGVRLQVPDNRAEEALGILRDVAALRGEAIPDTDPPLDPGPSRVALGLLVGILGGFLVWWAAGHWLIPALGPRL